MGESVVVSVGGGSMRVGWDGRLRGLNGKAAAFFRLWAGVSMVLRASVGALFPDLDRPRRYRRVPVL